MNTVEHRKIAISLRTKITKARNAAKREGQSLAEKLERHRHVKELENTLHIHLLNFFELTK